jgi:hypothetical protein
VNRTIERSRDSVQSMAEAYARQDPDGVDDRAGYVAAATEAADQAHAIETRADLSPVGKQELGRKIEQTVTAKFDALDSRKDLESAIERLEGEALATRRSGERTAEDFHREQFVWSRLAALPRNEAVRLYLDAMAGEDWTLIDMIDRMPAFSPIDADQRAAARRVRIEKSPQGPTIAALRERRAARAALSDSARRRVSEILDLFR